MILGNSNHPRTTPFGASTYNGEDTKRNSIDSVVAKIEEENPDCAWEEIAATLEDHGFEPVEFILGPVLD